MLSHNITIIYYIITLLYYSILIYHKSTIIYFLGETISGSRREIAYLKLIIEDQKKRIESLEHEVQQER